MPVNPFDQFGPATAAGSLASSNPFDQFDVATPSLPQADTSGDRLMEGSEVPRLDAGGNVAPTPTDRDVRALQQVIGHPAPQGDALLAARQPAGPSMFDANALDRENAQLGVGNMPTPGGPQDFDVRFGRGAATQYAGLDASPTMEAMPWWQRELGATGANSYDWIDNPLTRGLAQAGNTVATGLSYAAGKAIGAASPKAGEWWDRNETQPLAARAVQLQASPDLGLFGAAAQMVANLGGQLAIGGTAGLGGGAPLGTGAGLMTAARQAATNPGFRMAASLGVGQSGSEAAQLEAQGQTVSPWRFGTMAATDTAANLVPLNMGARAGAGLAERLATRSATGAGLGVAANEASNTAAGRDPGTGDLVAGVFGAGMGMFPARRLSTLADEGRALGGALRFDNVKSAFNLSVARQALQERLATFRNRNGVLPADVANQFAKDTAGEFGVSLDDLAQAPDSPADAGSSVADQMMADARQATASSTALEPKPGEEVASLDLTPARDGRADGGPLNTDTPLDQDVAVSAGLPQPRAPDLPAIEPGTSRDDLVQQWRDATTDNEKAAAAARIFAFDQQAKQPEPANVLQGSLGIQRADMPQIPTAQRDAFLAYLDDRGIGHADDEVAAGQLKPTQADFSPRKVESATRRKSTEQRRVLVSSDGYILDGHHQWLAHGRENEPVPITRLDAPIADLLPEADAFMQDGEHSTNPIPVRGTDAEKLDAIHRLTAENKPALDAFLADMDAALGTRSNSNVKTDESILGKASRPSILAKRPGHGIQHLRDTLRFKTIVPSPDLLPQIAQHIADRVRNHGWQIMKMDSSMLLKPKQWGWRAAVIDFRLPNGQMVEYYIPTPHMDATKNSIGHKLFEKWRGRDSNTLTPDDRAQRAADTNRSRDEYQRAWDQDLADAGVDESAVRASLNKFDATLSEAGENPASSKSPAVGSPGNAPRRQTPPTREARISRQQSSASPFDRTNAATGSDVIANTSSESLPQSPAQNVNASAPELTLQNRDRSRAASLAQMNGIAKNPDASRLTFSRDPNLGAPMVSGRDASSVPEADLGRADHVLMPGTGRKIPVRYAVVEADAVQASHHADGTVNRDYDGAPLQALNNGRVAGLKAAWRRGTGEGYRQGLIDDAALHGVSPDAIAGKRNPILVRLYDAAHNVGDMGAESNAAANLGLSPAEQARTDARALPDLSELPTNDAGELSTSPGEPFYRAFLRNLGSNEAAKLVDAQGRPNKTFFDRMRAAVFARAYGSDQLITAMAEDAHPDSRNVLQAMVKAAPAWAKIDRNGPLGDYAERIVAAFEVLRQAREAGQPVAQWLQQGDLIARDTRGDDWAAMFALDARAPNRIAAGLQEAARIVDGAQMHAQTGDMLGGTIPEPDAITKRVITLMEANRAAGKGKRQQESTARGPDDADRPLADSGGGDRGQSIGESGAKDGDAGVLPEDQIQGGIRFSRRVGDTATGDLLGGESVPTHERATARPTATTGDMFGGPTSRDHLGAAERAKDAKRNGLAGGKEDTRDGGLFDGARPEQVDLDTAAGQSTHYGKTRDVQRSGVSEPAAKAGRRSAGPVFGQLDLFVTKQGGGAVARAKQATAELLQHAKVVSVGAFHSGIKVIRDWRDAAHIIAPLRKLPQEQALAVVADADGRPIAVLRHSMGSSTASSVDVGTVFGAIAQIPGAKHVWFAHNHPSGLMQQSQADLNITRDLHNIMQGSGIETHGMIQVGPGHKTATYSNPDTGARGQEPTGDITPAARTGSVPIVERAFRRIVPKSSPKVTNPASARDVVQTVAKGRDGVVLLDNQNKLVGFMPVDTKDMARLRTDNPETGAAAIMRAATEAGANGSLLVVHSDAGIAGAKNVGSLLNSAGLRPLDLFVVSPDGKMRSLAEEGASITSGRFFSRGQEGQAAHTIDQVRDAARKGWGNRFITKLERAGVLHFLSVDEASRPEYSPDGKLVRPALGTRQDLVDGKVKGVYLGGKAYILHDQITSLRDVSGIVLHEAGLHFGFNKLTKPAERQALRNRVNRAIVAGDREVIAAWKHAEKVGTPARDLHEETMAYLAEHNPGNGIVQAVIDAVRRGLNRLGIPLNHLSDADAIRAMARDSLRQAAHGGAKDGAFKVGTDGQVAYSRATDAGDQRKGPSFYADAGVQFPGSGVELRAFNKSLKTGRDLVKYRAERDEAKFSRDLLGDDDSPVGRIRRDVAAAQRSALSQLAANGVAQGALGWTGNPNEYSGWRGNLQGAIAKLADKMDPVRRTQEAIQEAAGTILADEANAYRLENLMHGRVADRLDSLDRTTVKPLIEAMAKAKIDPALLMDYLYARHAPERNARIASINKNMPDGGSGMTTQQAQDILAGKADGVYSGQRITADNLPALKDLAARVDRLRNSTIDTLENSGQITPALAASLRKQWKYYVPLRGKEGEADTSAAGGGRGVDVRGKPIKRALGRGEGNIAQSHILAEMIGDAQRAIIQAEKNRVGRAILKLAAEHPNPDIWQVEPVDLEWKFSESTGEAYLGTRKPTNDQDVLTVMHKGQAYHVRLVDPRVRDAVLNLGAEKGEAFVRYVGALNRWLSAAFTRYSPAFIPINAIRDAVMGFTGLSSEQGARVALSAARGYFPAMRAAFRDARNPRGDARVSDADKQMDDWAREFAERGGKTGIVKWERNADTAKKLQRDFERGMGFMYNLSRNPRAAATQGLHALAPIVHAIEHTNDAVENAMRLSAYVALRKRGMSADKAAAYAKDLTVNFNRKGNVGPILNSLFLFYNASVQGARRGFQLMRDPRVAGFLGGLMALQASQTAILMARQQDDGISDWDAIPEYVKQRALIIALPGQGHYFAMPMPYEFGFLTYAGGRMTQWGMERNGKGDPSSHANVVNDLASGALQSFSPIPIDVGFSGLIPTGIRPFVQVYANKNDFEHMIYNDHPMSRYEMPGVASTKEGTAAPFVAMAKIMNRAGAGDDYTPPSFARGMLDWSPNQLEFLFNSYVGGMGTFGSRTWGATTKALAGNYKTDADGNVSVNWSNLLSELPILRRFGWETDRGRAQRAKFADIADDLERTRARIGDQLKQGNLVGAQEAARDAGIFGDGWTLKTTKDGQIITTAKLVDGKTVRVPQLGMIPGSLAAVYKEAVQGVSVKPEGERYSQKVQDGLQDLNGQYRHAMTLPAVQREQALKQVRDQQQGLMGAFMRFYEQRKAAYDSAQTTQQ